METNKKKALYGAIGTVSALAASALVSHYFSKRSDPGSDKMLSEMANEINKTTPMMVDAETQLTSVVGINKTIAYHYKLVNLSGSEDPTLTDKILGLKPGMIQRNCTTPDVRKDVLDKGITMSYRYYDRNSTHLVDVEVKPEDCEGLE